MDRPTPATATQTGGSEEFASAVAFRGARAAPLADPASAGGIVIEDTDMAALGVPLGIAPGVLQGTT